MDPYQFFCLIYGHFGESFGGCVTLAAGYGQGRLGGHCHFPVGELARAAECATSFAARRQEAYFGVGLTRPGVASSRRGHESDVVGLPGFWLDLDVGKPAPAPPAPPGLPSPPDMASALDVLCQLPVDRRPTLLVGSGGGVHAYWLFDRPLVLADDDQRRRARAASDAVQAMVRAIARPRGWSVDHTSDLTRVLRVPGTGNFKLATPRPVSVMPYSGQLYRPDDLLALGVVAAAPRAALAPQRVTARPRREIPGDKHVATYVAEQMLVAAREDLRPSVSALVAGQPYATEGGRDNAAQVLTSLAAWIAVEVRPQVTSEDLWPIFAASTAAMLAAPGSLGNPPPDEDEVRRKLDANIEDAWGKRSREWFAEDAAAEGVVATQMQMEAPRDFRDRLAGRSLEQLGQGYTPADIAFFAAQQGTTVEQWPKRWVIQHGASYWVYMNGRYRGPFQHIQIEGIIRDYLAPARIELSVGRRAKKLAELLNDYRTNALRVVGSLHRQVSVFDAASGDFHESLCPVVHGLDPEFSPEVDRWLRLLGDEQAEKLLDWIATATLLDLPSCALYLYGTKGSGKGMLAEGMSMLWGQKPTPLEAIFGNFNELLARCPLIFADEKLSVNAYDKGISGKLRALIASSSHSLNRKHVSQTFVDGCIRLLLASNNDGMLEDAREQNLTRDDVEAIAERFLFVKVSSRAKSYLDQLGGRRYTTDWVAGGKIARHALWLRDNRPVRLGARFAVHGEITTAIRSLVTGYGLGSAVSEWICGYLTSPERLAMQAGPEIHCGGGKLLLSTTAVANHWKIYVAHGNLPSTTAIGRALSNMSLRAVKRQVGERRFRCHDINLEFVYAWAAKHSVAAVDDLRARVAQGSTPEVTVDDAPAAPAPPAASNVVPFRPPA